MQIGCKFFRYGPVVLVQSFLSITNYFHPGAGGHLGEAQSGEEMECKDQREKENQGDI